MSSHHANKASAGATAALIVGALGVVFGDIGTSPLYALKVSVEASGARGGPEIVQAVFGILSLITWALILVVMVKYVFIIMRADNRGEGGIFALTALVLQHLKKDSTYRWPVTIAGALGAALFFGDSMITPAISVLSAVEGLKVLSPDLEKYVIVVSLGLITGLFAVERFGTAVIGKVFGPVMLVWFLSLGALGLAELVHSPGIFAALSPLAFPFCSPIQEWPLPYSARSFSQSQAARPCMPTWGTLAAARSKRPGCFSPFPACCSITLARAPCCCAIRLRWTTRFFVWRRLGR
jgi:KUP system potassium uptake protein